MHLQQVSSLHSLRNGDSITGFREGRKGIDMVNDGVENSLMREVDKIKSCQDQMKRTLEQVNHQLGVNRNARHQLERDMANKDHSINIDHTCHNLQNTSRAINLHGGIEKVDPNISIPETWADFSNRNIQASQCKYLAKVGAQMSTFFIQLPGLLLSD